MESKILISLFYGTATVEDQTRGKQLQRTEIDRINSDTIILVINKLKTCKQGAFTHTITYKSKLLIIMMIDNVIMSIDNHLLIKIVL